MFSIPGDTLIAEFNDLSRGHNVTKDKVLRICRELQKAKKLNKTNAIFDAAVFLFLPRSYHETI